jgi:hypothetical protein
MLLAATLLSVGAVTGFAHTPAHAQVGIEVGPGGMRIHEDRPYRPVVERRRHVERRVVVEDDVEECRTEVRRRINRFGEREVRRVRICE